MILKYVDSSLLNNSIFYICGPPGMLKAMRILLQEDLEIPKERIKVEEFTGYWWFICNELSLAHSLFLWDENASKIFFTAVVLFSQGISICYSQL